MTIDEINNLEEKLRREELRKCCGSRSWVNKLNAQFPVLDEEDLLEKSDSVWAECVEEDWLEAFTHHPKIGDVDSLKKKFASTAAWAGNEQSGVNAANDEVIQALAKGNDDYEKKFGFIFIVCATGKSAEEMLALLSERIHNDRDTEIHIAAAEQNKITQLRLKKLIA